MGHKIYLKNKETGEEQVFINNVSGFRAPWYVDRIEKYNDPTTPKGRTDARIAMWAEKLGLPVAQFFDVARLLLQKDCPFCQMGTQVLKAINELGDEKTEWALNEILAAKEAHDHERLARVKELLWQSAPTTSPT